MSQGRTISMKSKERQTLLKTDRMWARLTCNRAKEKTGPPYKSARSVQLKCLKNQRGRVWASVTAQSPGELHTHVSSRHSAPLLHHLHQALGKDWRQDGRPGETFRHGWKRGVDTAVGKTEDHTHIFLPHETHSALGGRAATLWSLGHRWRKTHAAGGREEEEQISTLRGGEGYRPGL